MSPPSWRAARPRRGSRRNARGQTFDRRRHGLRPQQRLRPRILRGEIACKKVYEDEHVLAFHDISPQTQTHVLVIPRGEYASFDDFSEKASAAEIAGLVRALGHVAREQGVAETGYRILANSGPAAHQEVPHFHVHLFGGRDLGECCRGGDQRQEVG